MTEVADVMSVGVAAAGGGEGAAAATGCEDCDGAASAAGRELTRLDSSRSGTSATNDCVMNESCVNVSPCA